MPHLQKLADRYKDRTDVQVITFNMDENPGLIEPVVRDKKLSVVVLPAYSFVTDVLKVQGLPQNWIVDSTATIRAKAYTWNVANWETAMSEAIERHKQ